MKLTILKMITCALFLIIGLSLIFELGVIIGFSGVFYHFMFFPFSEELSKYIAYKGLGREVLKFAVCFAVAEVTIVKIPILFEEDLNNIFILCGLILSAVMMHISTALLYFVIEKLRPSTILFLSIAFHSLYNSLPIFIGSNVKLLIVSMTISSSILIYFYVSKRKMDTI